MTKPTDLDVSKTARDEKKRFGGRLVYILPESLFPHYDKYGLYESGLIEWSKQLCSKDKVFLDIGAHTGTYTVALASLSKEVYSFEPQRSSYYALCGSVSLSGLRNVTCLNVGLGSPDQVGKRTLHIKSPDGGCSSLHKSSTADFSDEEVAINTMDSYHLDNIGFIKLDVEENELQVLMGATETLRRNGHPTILLESNGPNPALFDYIATVLCYKKTIKVARVANMYLCEG